MEDDNNLDVVEEEFTNPIDFAESTTEQSGKAEEIMMPENFFEKLTQKHSMLSSHENLVEELSSSGEEGGDMNVEGQDSFSFPSDFFYRRSMNSNSSNEANHYLVSGRDVEGIEEEGFDIPQVDAMQIELLREKRKNYLGEKLEEFGLDIIVLRAQPTYNHILEQYLNGKGIFFLLLFLFV